MLKDQRAVGWIGGEASSSKQADEVTAKTLRSKQRVDLLIGGH